ncbi:GAF domain-containing protein [Kitasatospora sp. NBC_00240]|uniref:GAF domain-containing protein n=1 Tax=Kitasatospora sp. NBC_00240 TaxID=2903567 RepID=UPI00224D0ADC|nr:GAF domain-containing protein [Kitasatospora sp. NBC_00240]MCX5209395.1 GAF domain-containing protein [Kitasatospora sp. NBC_00240]
MNRQDVLATALAVTDSDTGHRELLQSVVEAARGVFGARAASIIGLDPGTEELVFEAVSGEGEDFLVGNRFPAARGIAGWVLVSAEPVIVDDLAQSPVFDRDIAESTRYVPDALMAAPLLHGDRVLGVLEVLDRDVRRQSALRDLDWLGLFAAQAAAALATVQRARSARQVLHGEGSAELTEVVALVQAFTALPAERRDAGRRLLQALTEALAARP